MMGTEIFKIDASWAEKLIKKRVSFLTAPTVVINLHLAKKNYVTLVILYKVLLDA